MELTALLGVCVVSAAVITLIRQYKSEYAVFISVAAGGAVLLSVLLDIGNGLLEIRNAVSSLGVDVSYFFVALKALGICVITGFIADTCRDSGNTALAAKAELAGRCAVFLLSVPLLISVFETACRFIGK